MKQRLTIISIDFESYPLSLQFLAWPAFSLQSRRSRKHLEAEVESKAEEEEEDKVLNVRP